MCVYISLCSTSRYKLIAFVRARAFRASYVASESSHCGRAENRVNDENTRAQPYSVKNQKGSEGRGREEESESWKRLSSNARGVANKTRSLSARDTTNERVHTYTYVCKHARMQGEMADRSVHIACHVTVSRHYTGIYTRAHARPVPNDLLAGAR